MIIVRIEIYTDMLLVCEGSFPYMLTLVLLDPDIYGFKHILRPNNISPK